MADIAATDATGDEVGRKWNEHAGLLEHVLEPLVERLSSGDEVGRCVLDRRDGDHVYRPRLERQELLQSADGIDERLVRLEAVVGSDEDDYTTDMSRDRAFLQDAVDVLNDSTPKRHDSPVGW